MSKKRLSMMVGGTVFSALAIGLFMQRGETAAPRDLLAPLDTAIQQRVMAPTGPVEDTDDLALLGLQSITLTSAMPISLTPTMLPNPVPQDTGLNADLQNSGLVTVGLKTQPIQDETTTAAAECDVIATAVPGHMATVDLSVSAPCYKNQRVTIHHSGMMFTEATGIDGNLSVTVPALAERAVFIVALTDGTGAVATTDVPSLKDYDRVVLQWSGNAGFQLHALEFNAFYGGKGHVWSGVPNGRNQNGGLVMQLGDSETLEPQMAEVYTFPTGASKRSGKVALSIETEVTAANCGREISAQSLELHGAGPLRTRDLVLSVPDCSATGDFLVLNNLVEDLNIAAR